MRKTMNDAISQTVSDMLKSGLSTSFTEKELNSIGIEVSEVNVTAQEIKEIRETINLSQSVFAKLLNVSVSSVRQWEQGKRTPTGSTKVLLELLGKEPHLLDYRLTL